MPTDPLPLSILIWACPFAFVLHVAEEYPHFTGWVQRHLNHHYSQRQYNRLHLTGAVIGILAAGVLSVNPTRTSTLLYFSLILAPGYLWNTFFHVGGSLVYRARSPGVFTAMLIHFPLFVSVSWTAISTDLLSWESWGFSTLAGGLFHFLEVQYNVIRWGRSGTLH